MKKPTISQIENAFLPAREIEAPEKFAGRKEQIQTLWYALVSDGSNIAVVGNRGVGKSSLSRQLMSIAGGSNTLLERLGLKHEGSLDFLSIYFACGGEIETYEQLLERLLTLKTCLADWIYDVPSARKAVDTYKPKFSVGVISLEGNKQTETTESPALVNHSIDTVFTNVLSAMVEQKLARNGILIVIDEFDQITNPSGFAGLLKSLATNVPQVKFCLVGVAQDIQNLMKEHESSDRLFAGGIVHLPPMAEAELKEIISIAESSIGGGIQFDSGARDELVKLAQGHPYMIHLIGKYALRAAFQADRAAITRADIQTTLRDIAERGADPVLEGRYKKAVASSPAREIVLKALAQCRGTDGEIRTADAYKIALDQGVDNASQYVGSLVTPDYGSEIAKVRERYYRFKDSLFYAYVSARPRIFTEPPAHP
jgi:hypothetical protein